jgi:hypothetical protein
VARLPPAAGKDDKETHNNPFPKFWHVRVNRWRAHQNWSFIIAEAKAAAEFLYTW